MNSSYSSESASSLLAESTTSGAASSCCDHAIEEIDEDRWNLPKSPSQNRQRPLSMIESSQKCQTMLCRTTGSSEAKSHQTFPQTFPNCGTYFFKHISDGEDDEPNKVEELQSDSNCNNNDVMKADENCNNSLGLTSLPDEAFDEDDLNQNQVLVYDNSTGQLEIDSMSPRSEEPASIEQLVMGAEDLVVMRRKHHDTRMVRSASYTKYGVACKTTRPTASDHEDLFEDEGMDCERDEQRLSNSSLSALVDSLIVHHEGIEHQKVSISTDEEDDDDVTCDATKLTSRRHMHHDEDRSSCYSDEDFHFSDEDQHEHEVEEEEEGEDEELSEYWDQEKYLSEHNYDEQIDEDSTLKLLNFGDDYRKFIDSMSEGDLSDQGLAVLPVVTPSSPTAATALTAPAANPNASTPNAKQKLKRRIRRSTTVREVYDSVSESELDDAWRVALHSRTKLNEVKQRFRNVQDDEDLLDIDAVANNTEELTSLKDLCFENVECILKLLEENPQNSNTIILKKTKRSFKGLLRHWQEMLHLIVKRLQLSKSLSKLILDIQTLESNLEDVSKGHNEKKQQESTSSKQNQIHNKTDLEKNIQELKTSVVDLTKYKSDLFQINLEIHNFLADFYSSIRKDPQRIPTLIRRDATLTSTSLKEKVIGLYALWDETFHWISSLLVNAESTYCKILEFECERERLIKLKQETQKANFDNANTNIKRNYFRTKNSLSVTEDSGISESGDNDNEETILIKLRRLAQDLENKLTPDSHLLREITESLQKSASDYETGKISLQKVHQTNGKCARIPSNDRKTKKPQKIEEQNSTKSDEATESFSWRIFYASIPFQFLLLAAIFLAWTYEPKCCEATNSYVLLPQLRYMNGPPPI